MEAVEEARAAGAHRRWQGRRSSGAARGGGGYAAAVARCRCVAGERCRIVHLLVHIEGVMLPHIRIFGKRNKNPCGAHSRNWRECLEVINPIYLCEAFGD